MTKEIKKLEREFIPLSGNVRKEIEEIELAELKIQERLEYLRGEIEKECISYGEIAELQELAEYIEDGDVVLLEWAGVPEHERTDEEIEEDDRKDIDTRK